MKKLKSQKENNEITKITALKEATIPRAGEEKEKCGFMQT
jgi:hypothetical protein